MPNQNDLQKAHRDLQVAQEQFDQADADHVDIAIHRLKAAELRYGNVIRSLKEIAS